MSTSFWQQDINWSAHQQGWTRSFYQVNQNWTRELSGASSSGAAPAPPQTDQSSSASIINPDALDIQVEAHWNASQSGSNGNSVSDPTTRRNRLDLLA